MRNWKRQGRGSRARVREITDEKGQGIKFFIDTANVNEIREAASLGVVDGVTTNPSLIVREGRAFKQLIAEICPTISW